ADSRVAVALDGSWRRETDGGNGSLAGVSTRGDRFARFADCGRRDRSGSGTAPKSAGRGSSQYRVRPDLVVPAPEPGLLRHHRDSLPLRPRHLGGLRCGLMGKDMSADKGMAMTLERKNRQRGTALIEFTLILPLLLVLTVAVVDFGRAFFIK